MFMHILMLIHMPHLLLDLTIFSSFALGVSASARLVWLDFKPSFQTGNEMLTWLKRWLPLALRLSKSHSQSKDLLPWELEHGGDFSKTWMRKQKAILLQKTKWKLNNYYQFNVQWFVCRTKYVLDNGCLMVDINCINNCKIICDISRHVLKIHGSNSWQCLFCWH